MPISAIACTAFGSKPFGAIPAEAARQRSPKRAFTHPSAIRRQAALPAQRHRTVFTQSAP